MPKPQGREKAQRSSFSVPFHFIKGFLSKHMIHSVRGMSGALNCPYLIMCPLKVIIPSPKAFERMGGPLQKAL